MPPSWSCLLPSTWPAPLSFPGGSDGSESCLQCRRPGFDPWVGKIPWRRERLPTPVFWPEEFHGQSMRLQRVGHNRGIFIFTFHWYSIIGDIFMFFIFYFYFCLCVFWLFCKRKNKKSTVSVLQKKHAYAFHTIYILLMFVLIKQSCF